MTWSYDTTLAAAKDRVRLYVGDTDTTDQQFSDEEIVAVVARSASERAAAAELASSLSLRYARKANVTSGPLSVQWSSVSAAYAARAADLMSSSGGNVPGIAVGGSTYSQRDRLSEDTDRIPPALRTGAFRNPAAGTASTDDSADDDPFLR